MEIVQLMISDLTCDFMFSPVCIFLVSSTTHNNPRKHTYIYSYKYCSPQCSKTVFPYMDKEKITTFILISLHQIFWGISQRSADSRWKCLSWGSPFFFLVFVLHLKWDHSRALCLPGSVADGETPSSSSSSSQLLSWRLRSPHWLKTVKNLERRERKSGNPPFPFFSLSLWLVHIMTEEKPFKQCCAPWSTSQCISVITSTKCVLEQLCNHV